jgi:peptidoglycan/LPS O-acetylase OafA/YrhL
MNRLAIILGVALLAIAVGTAPMPLTMTLQDPTRNVTIYPNVLFAVPLILLGALLLLYGITVKNQEDAPVR